MQALNMGDCPDNIAGRGKEADFGTEADCVGGGLTAASPKSSEPSMRRKLKASCERGWNQ